MLLETLQLRAAGPPVGTNCGKHLTDLLAGLFPITSPPLLTFTSARLEPQITPWKRFGMSMYSKEGVWECAGDGTDKKQGKQ